MSAAKMVADSTQGDVPEMSGTKKRKKMVQKKKVKKKKESTKKSKRKTQQEEEFDDSDLDLEKDVYPISYYVKDRESLLDQMFQCVRGQSLNRALPDVLKELPFEDLKKRCMEQLEVMSKKRIRRILAGDDPASISSSGTEDESSDEESQEIEEGEVEFDIIDSQVVDSTSCTMETADSDREIDFDEGSVGHSSQSPYPSDEEFEDQQQCDENDEDAGGSNEDVKMEEDSSADIEQIATPGEPEEPEEGEVFDDNSNPGLVDNEVTEENKESDSVLEVKKKEEWDTVDASKVNDLEKVEVTVEKSNVEVGENPEEIVESKVVDLDSNDDIEKKGKVGIESKNDDEANEENTDCDTRTVKTKGSVEDKIQEDTKDVLQETVFDEDQVIIVEADHMIDDEAAYIADDEDNEEVSDDEEEVEEKDNTSEQVDKSLSEAKSVKQPRRIVKPPSQMIAPALTRNQMELLELEMRARAIKAMLKTAK